MSRTNRRTKKTPTVYFFDSFKHFKNNLSNLIAIELPTLHYLGPERYLKIIESNYKSKYPDMRKIGLIDYDKPSDNKYELTEEAKEIYQGRMKDFFGYSEKNIDVSKRNNIKSISPRELFDRLEELRKHTNFDLERYKTILLKLILSYFDTADCLRPYLALLTYLYELNITHLDKDTLLNILAQTKENILLGKYTLNKFKELDPLIQEEIGRPVTYIKNFLKTGFIINDEDKIIIDQSQIRRIQLEMEKAVIEQSKSNSRPAQEQSRFRQEVLKAYQYRCAITGESIAIEQRYLLEAAHIIPYRDGGAFSVTNGIALSYEMHKMFDNGLFGFWYDDKGKLRIKVSRSKKIKDSGKKLEQLDNKEVFLPKEKKMCPDISAIQVNLEKNLLL